MSEAKGQGTFYHRIAKSIINNRVSDLRFRELGDRLITIAEQAYAFRRAEALEEISRVLTDLPLPGEYKSAGQYYHALSLMKAGRGDRNQACVLFEQLACDAPPSYRSRALISLGTIAWYQSDNQSALSLYTEAGQQATLSGVLDGYTLMATQKMIAVCKSMAGDHQGALKILADLFPLANSACWSQPQVYFDYFNSYAVELAEVGRLEEARRCSQVALASPFAPAYPEWRETFDEIVEKEKQRRASPSVVAVHRKDKKEKLAEDFRVKRNLAIKQSRLRYSGGRPAKILPFPVPSVLDDVPDELCRLTPQQVKQMSFRRLQATVIAATCDDDTSRDALENMLRAAGLVIDEEQAAPNEIDLEKSGNLESLVVRWVNGDISPDAFAAVMSALRDCKDDLRRTNLMDRIISYAFNETPERLTGEDKWRRRVEAHLPPEESDA